MVEGRDAIKKTFTHKDFNAAWGFMSRIALKVSACNTLLRRFLVFPTG
jgi:4a-hydroxytetrahydrobiopterin dehydratase